MTVTVYRYGPAVQGALVKRYKRFLADVMIDTCGADAAGEPASANAVTCHCPNTGPMTGLLDRCACASAASTALDTCIQDC